MMAFLFLAGTFAGCLASEPAPVGRTLQDIYGSSVTKGRLHLLIKESILEGRFVAANETGEWNATPATTILVKLDNSKKPDVGPLGGDGVSKALDLAGQDVALQVRLKKAAELEGYMVRYSLIKSEPMPATHFGFDKSGSEEQQRQPPRPPMPMTPPKPANCSDLHRTGGTELAPSEPFKVPITGPTMLLVHAEIVRGRETGIVCERLLALANVHWTVDGSIFPVGALAAGATTPNADKMADLYPFTVGNSYFPNIANATWMGQFGASTSYRGAWAPDQGTFLDLQASVKQDVRCGIGASPPLAPEQFAEYQIFTQFVDSMVPVQVRVGMSTSDCASPFGQAKAYSNPAPVPYTLEIDVKFDKTSGFGPFPSPR